MYSVIYERSLSIIRRLVVLEKAVDASLYLYTIHRQLIIIMDRVFYSLTEQLNM